MPGGGNSDYRPIPSLGGDLAEKEGRPIIIAKKRRRRKKAIPSEVELDLSGVCYWKRSKIRFGRGKGITYYFG